MWHMYKYAIKHPFRQDILKQHFEIPCLEFKHMCHQIYNADYCLKHFKLVRLYPACHTSESLLPPCNISSKVKARGTSNLILESKTFEPESSFLEIAGLKTSVADPDPFGSVSA